MKDSNQRRPRLGEIVAWATSATRPSTTTILTIATIGLTAALACGGRHRIGRFDVDPDSPAAVVTSLAVDSASSCAITAGGGALCWGMKLPIGDTPPDPTLFDDAPADQRALAGAARIVGSDLKNACAIMSDHRVLCWGDNYDGQLGRGDVGGTTTVPGPVPGLRAQQIAAGTGHRCALLADGTVTCWGSNGWGECGTAPSATPQAAPTAVPDLTNVVEIAAALGHTCARRDDGSVWCFGFNQYGQVGVPDDGSHSARLTRVALPAPATHVGGNGTVTCASIKGTQGGEVWCWGVWKEADTLIPAAPTHLFTGGAVHQIVGAAGRLCIVRAPTFDFPSGGGCADNATTGVAGQGVEGMKLTQIRGGPWVEIAASPTTACAIDSGGAAWCWGDNTQGQIGTGMAGDIWPNPTPILR